MKKIATIRHSCSHIMAFAVQELYPKVKFGIGPAIEDGFYYDFDNLKISDDELSKIEDKMRELIKANLKFGKKIISKAEAKKLFKNQPYKLDLIKEQKDKLTIYQVGSFIDLCKGPHLKSTKEINPDAFKITKIAGAYWRGDEKNKMLTRIYGVAFETKKELDGYLKKQKEIEKRDHRILGKKLDLFSFHPGAPGDIFWHPKGFTVIKELYKYWREIHQREGYQEVRSPVLLTRKIWQQSKHTDFFIDKMYKVTTPDSKEWNMAVRPMNCDGHIIIYKSQIRSYKEFPLRLAELGVVHRYEISGEVHGILRPREFTQDDAHIFCTPDQVKEELKKVMDLCFEVYKKFGLNLDRLELSTRPGKSIGTDEIWEQAEKTMRQVLKEGKIPHQINEGDGAFYGPKFDFHLKDAIGRTWQCSTIQLDFAQPENFDLRYVTKKGNQERPVMIHRVLYGSIERFLGILLEHYAGALPLWLSPEQVWIIPVGSRHRKYAHKVGASFMTSKKGTINRAPAKIRYEIKDENETVAKKIREGEIQKIPYLLVVGDKEIKEKSIRVRQREKGDVGIMTIDKFLEKIKIEIEKRR